MLTSIFFLIKIEIEPVIILHLLLKELELNCEM
jgi:hypothetical protein